MYLEKIIFHNRAPFDHIEMNFRDTGANVLTSINGKGKTTILSHVTDAFYELAKPAFPQEFEGKENKLYRISSPLYNITFDEPSIVYCRFKESETIYDYIDIRGNCTKEQYNHAIDVGNKINYYSFQGELTQQGFSKFWNFQNNDFRRNIFEQNVLNFFPAYRFEIPSYINNAYLKPIEHLMKNRITGYLPNQIEVISDITYFANWLLDIVLDMKINEQIQFVVRNNNLIPVTIPAKENNILTNLNIILSNILSSKKYKGNIRFGIGNRNGGMTRIAIMNDIDNEHLTICPSIFQLSSGELALISMFGEIIHQADNLMPNISLNEIKGIVLVDEIEKHLHITLQKVILPKLFTIFPNIQFIVSSHSPFLNMGLAEQLPESHKIFDLNHNGVSCSAYKNELYEEVYNMMILENVRYAELYNGIKKKIETLKKTLVITEGKTDIKHILKAKEKLGITDIDFEIIQKEYQPGGDPDLHKLLEQISHINNTYKIIGIFDRDIKSTVDEIEKNGQSFKDYGNNVFAFCIPIPDLRRKNNQKEISIEYLYNDNEIHSSVDIENRHLFFGNEFNEAGRGIINPNLMLSMPDGRTKDKIIESLGGQKVTDINGNNILATKDNFVEAIKQEKINISDESWNNFKPIFDRIKDILNKN